MKERPILFSGPMVRAIREGRKTQTRRIIKPQPSETHWDIIPGYKLLVNGPHNLSCGRLGWRFQHCIPQNPVGDKPTWAVCPYGQPGDRLWVRETFRLFNSIDECSCYDNCSCASKNGRPIYRVDCDTDDKWTPSIHMPRWASRITLEIVSVRVERLQDISEDDAKAEGIHQIAHGRSGYYYSAFNKEPDPKNWCHPDSAYKELWDSINGHGSWNLNPWVWVIEFKEAKP